MRSKDFEEILQAIWELEEQKIPATLDNLKKIKELADITNLELQIQELITKKYINVNDNCFTFTTDGYNLVKNIVRKYRLTQRLFNDVLLYRDEKAKQDACEIEHIISDEAIEHICVLLGHPSLCPDGKSIPEGECCIKKNRNLTPLIKKLTDADLEKDLKIMYIETHNSAQLDKISSFGIAPGAIIKLQQRAPAFVLQTGNTKLAIDADIAEKIYIKQLS